MNKVTFNLAGVVPADGLTESQEPPTASAVKARGVPLLVTRMYLLSWPFSPLCPELKDSVLGTAMSDADPGLLTVTVAEADLVVSATLVAVTVKVPAAPGAV